MSRERVWLFGWDSSGNRSGMPPSDLDGLSLSGVDK